ncbi:hypothetical protein DYB34_012962, partial [Aphanomyces astaci]
PLIIGSWLKANGFDIYGQWGGSNDWVGFSRLTYFDKTEVLLRYTTLDDLRTIVEYKLIHASSKHLTPEFRTANWNFFEKKIYGEDEELPREKFCLYETAETLGDLLGQYYLDEVIATADWLDNSTLANAQTKMSKLVHLLGGPEKPQLYPTLTLDSKSYLNNRWKVSQVNVDTNLKLNGQPVEHKWGEAPHVVNAYYGPRENLIIVPANILQKPLFDDQFDAAQNFGGIGSFIGHEITHGFDNIGRYYDGDGNVNPWWSDASIASFKTKAQCFSDQYSNFVVKSVETGDVLGNINGKLTLDENIADNGGLKTSFRAYHEYLKKFPSQYTEETGDKLFYLSFAQSWCSKYTDTSLSESLKREHPPGRFRVTGTLQNDAEFAR